jgi:ElaB/YqjD/DUF883 family membrane-anchored ribosome-binding protein
MASQNPSSLHARRVREAEHSSNEAEITERASDVLKDTFNELKERSDDVKATVKEYVHQKPFKALGIAMLSGMAIALLMRR